MSSSTSIDSRSARRSPSWGPKWLANRSGRSTAAGPCTRNFSTTWAPFRITCTRTTSRRRSYRAGRQTRVILFSAATERHRQQLPVYLLRPRTGNDQARDPPLPRPLERRGQWHPELFEGDRLQTGNRLACSPVRAARPRKPRPRMNPNGGATCSACISRWSRAGPCPDRYS